MNTKNKNSELIKRLAVLAVFTALSYICVCVFRIKVAGFLTFDIKDAVITVAAMLFGPLSGVSISLTVSLIEMLTISETMFYGFIMNFLSSAAFSAVAGLIYKYKRNMLGAVMGLVASVFSLVAVMMAANLLITPYYMGMAVGDVAALIPKVLFPFNLTKSILNASLVMLIYKPISTALKRARMIKSSGSAGFDKKSTVLVTVISALILVASFTVFFLILGGKISFL